MDAVRQHVAPVQGRGAFGENNVDLPVFHDPRRRGGRETRVERGGTCDAERRWEPVQCAISNVHANACRSTSRVKETRQVITLTGVG